MGIPLSEGMVVISIKYKRRWGDRFDGRKIRSLDPMTRIAGFIMPNRCGATNLLKDSFPIEKVEKYIRQKRVEGLKDFGMLHVLIAAYVRMVSQRPGVNRYFSGQTVYARRNIMVAMTIKKEMNAEAPDTTIKVVFEPDSTAAEIYEKFNKAVTEYKQGADGANEDFTGTVKILNHIPRLLLKFVVWFLKMLDYFGLLPRFLVRDVSPFHASMFITSMGSLGIPPIYHHLYDFGNVPLFLSYGSKRSVNEIQRDGTVVRRKYLDFTAVTDERICDGFYFASALRLFKSIMDDPEQLDVPPDEIVEDIP